jgi:formate hydrogenlyase subunit 3/multisubunit Na+/H+ antiporter MnhD subunit
MQPVDAVPTAACVWIVMVAWESMALSSFFLVTSDHARPAMRRTGYLYLLIAPLGAIAILLSYSGKTTRAGDAPPT